jgi:FKBP-type peptidyl-prolyl cis-trans isomerase
LNAIEEQIINEQHFIPFILMKIKSIILCMGLFMLTVFTVHAQQNENHSAAEVAAENKAFLEKNKTQPGVVVLPSGLQYKIIRQGSGALPVDTSRLRLQYDIQLINGKSIYNTYKAKGPWDHHIDKALPGMQEALKLMPEGSKWIIYIPSELGFGESGDGNMIPPGSNLICELELIRIL